VMITTQKVRESYDRRAAFYNVASSMQRHLAAKLADVVYQDGIGFSTILDIGCGTGYFAEELKKSGYVYLGCDISLGMLKQAAIKTAVYYIQADAIRLPFKNGFFQTVVSSSAYQWVDDLKSAFAEVAGVLRCGGRFYFTIFNKNTLWQLQKVCEEIGIINLVSVAPLLRRIP